MLHIINSPELNQRLQHLELLHDLYHRIADIREITPEQAAILHHLRQEDTLSEEARVMVDRIFYHLRRKQRSIHPRYCSVQQNS
ncbi:hypothetical protein PN441_00505 [Spirulina major CS-329]|uniref:hypothetical protein n=1 Tax=Spirulina TaxID=1154 RepID=UPI00232C9DB7|nr:MULTISPECIES: hypothetical protein [Spirulina]MDB9495133.1 hypothetical protein [Spirulina subsalsa CS-330]MDB9501534.1 hypothetical protein [Spirulina major CS-329]